MALYNLPAHELGNKLRKKEVSSVELTRGFLNRIAEVEPEIGAFVTLCGETALESAALVDAKIGRGEPIAPLAGIAGAIKDILCIKGVKTTCSSHILDNFIAPYDATVIAKLKQNDAVFIGKANMDEFAMGSTTETSYFKKTKNPWALDCTPGGSSGGSAASVAAGEAAWSLGSDTGGSIRQPASFTGTVGLKPTYGRVSRYGCVAFASSLDQVGPITRDVTDCALVLNAISGHCEHDSTSYNLAAPDFTKALTPDIKGMKIGVPKEYFGAGLDKMVEEKVRGAIKHLSGLGAEIVDVSLPHTEYAVATYYIIAPAEASANLARFDGVKYGYRAPGCRNLIEMTVKTRTQGFGNEVKRRIMLGTYVLSSGYYDAYYNKAMKVRTLIIEDFKKVFGKVDILACPTAPTTALPLGSMLDPLSIYMLDVYTIPVNMAGLPGISLPCGFSGGKPVGLQLIGRALDEMSVLRAAYTYEQSAGFHKTAAPLGGVSA
ncbi:MAG: Asp-tRNA(Asn)/Glu-tRNA(Gln) amidotransferase subunit GatA [Acidaminococcales bacterium]|jgi:aspartyl-tRNA(Asn)/glutamyl-tRNA(Gln) amidotransferase subunit A|nr:Asp-tRNA(Asn)/Glu-tRNA(Gln) amidotransferase subunit GatA [Acidaminococcales bacterium]